MLYYLADPYEQWLDVAHKFAIDCAKLSARRECLQFITHGWFEESSNPYFNDAK